MLFPTPDLPMKKIYTFLEYKSSFLKVRRNPKRESRRGEDQNQDQNRAPLKIQNTKKSSTDEEIPF